MSTANPRTGYLLALSAYFCWGLFPLYFKLLEHLPASLIIVHRVIWSAVFGGLLLVLYKHPGWLKELLAHPRRLLLLGLSSVLIAANWLIYVWAVNNGHMLEASLGYYINPLVNVLLALLVLGERLRPLQWLAVACAALGVALELWVLGKLPWIALALALSFASYGLLRRQLPVPALPGLVVETWLLLPLALIWLFSLPASQIAGNGSAADWLLVIAAGPVTLVPLLCFNAAARHLPFSTLGFLQYLAPTLVLLMAVYLFGEELPRDKLMAFICIWVGLLIYSLDAWGLHRRQSTRRKLAP